jgi:hypothetical protein
MRAVVHADDVALVFTRPKDGGTFPLLVKVSPLLVAAQAGHISGLGVGESSNCQIVLDNSKGIASKLLDHPLRNLVEVFDDAGEPFFRGLVQSFIEGTLLTLTLEAGIGNLLLSEKLPLRTTKNFGDLTRASFPLIRLTELRYFVADHPMEVTEVFLDQQKVFSWQASTESDEAGHTWTIVTFGASVPEATKAAARGRGKRDVDTGVLIENPAELAQQVMAITGDYISLPTLRAQASSLGITMAARVVNMDAIKNQMQDLFLSVGAIFTGDDAQLYPIIEDTSPVFDLRPDEVESLSSSAALMDTADVLRLAYDRSDATGKPLRFLELAASPTRYNGLPFEATYPYLRNADAAEKVGRAVLSRLAGKRRDVTFGTSNKRVRVGQRWRLNTPLWTLPLSAGDPIVNVLKVERSLYSNSIQVAGEILLTVPAIRVTAFSAALPDTIEASIEVIVRDGLVTFTITDRSGRPIAGARMAIDGGEPKTANAQGQVSFTAKTGRHELAVQAQGYIPFTVSVTL